ncbi:MULTISPECIES: hypothetical protein [Sphingobium]|jgi:hypothetical protein|uniref:hypothetical protein n=1 Tax=Sphingobium TaxID=165695 RepID=UPI00242EB92E|nr:hypothetical protein [Sphingobium yanoikuyae]
MTDPTRLKAIWNQKEIPVFLRREEGRPRLRLPCNWNSYAHVALTRNWIRAGRHSIPESDYKRRYWEVPASWFNELLKQLLQEYGKLYVIQPFREQEKCSQMCWDAKGHECQCSCMGKNHGQGKSGHWLEISETFATRWGEMEYACRLLTMKKNGGA